MQLNLDNLNTIMTSCANAAQLFAVAGGATLLTVWWIPHATGLRGFSLRLFFLGSAMVALGWNAPSAVNSLSSMGSSAASIAALSASIVFLLSAAASCLTVYFVPSFFATKVNKKRKRNWIVAINILGFLPVLWLAAFVWSCLPDKENAGTAEPQLAQAAASEPPAA